MISSESLERARDTSVQCVKALPFGSIFVDEDDETESLVVQLDLFDKVYTVVERRRMVSRCRGAYVFDSSVPSTWSTHPPASGETFATPQRVLAVLILRDWHSQGPDLLALGEWLTSVGEEEMETIHRFGLDPKVEIPMPAGPSKFSTKEGS